MPFWLVFLSATTAYGMNRISQPNLKAVNFAKSIEGRKLNGSVIKQIEVDSEGVCRLECVEEERCQSYNFGIIENPAGRFVCQLSDSDRFVGLVNFTKDDDFKYRGMQVMFGNSILLDIVYRKGCGSHQRRYRMRSRSQEQKRNRKEKETF